MGRPASGLSRGVKIGAGMVVLLAAYIYQLPPTINPATPPSIPIRAFPAPSDKLSKMKHMYRKMDGAENLAFDGDNMYAGLVDGRVVRVDLSQGKFSQIETVTFTGDPQRALPYPCGKFETEPICGRPMGLVMDQNGKLVVADAYFGLVQIDLETSKMKALVKKPDDDRLKKFKSITSLTQGSSGKLYITEPTMLRQLRFHMYDTFEGRYAGRVFVYDPSTKKATTLMMNMALPTGIAVSEDEQHLFVAEQAKARVVKIKASKSKNAKSVVVADELPLWPERVTMDVDGKHLWVAGHPRSSSSLLQRLAGLPALRGLLAKMLSPGMMDWCMPTGSLVLRIDASTGAIMESFNDPTGRSGTVAGVYPNGDNVWFAMHTSASVRYVGMMTRQELGLA